MNIPLFTPTTQPLDLGDWNAEAKGQKVHVWVDPPRDFLREKRAFNQEYVDFLTSLVPAAPPPTPPQIKKYDLERGESKKQKTKKDILLEECQRLERMEAFLREWNPRVYAWYAKLWSYGPAEALHPTAAETLQLNEGNPKFLAWLIRRSNEILDGYRGVEKKG